MRYAICLLPLLLTACASGGWGDGRVAISTASNGQEFGGAVCTVMNNAGSWNVTTPASIQTGRAEGELRIVCNKPGYRTSELRLPPYGQSASSMGVGLGGGSGGVGVGLGFSLPIASGGGSYPPRIVVNMHPL
jgi:hypothetical protein